MIASSILARLLGPKVWLGALLAVALVAAGYVAWNTWDKTLLEGRLQQAQVEVIRQDARIEKQNEEVVRVQEEAGEANIQADIRAIKELNRPRSSEGFEPGPDAMNRWLEEYRDED